MVKLIKFKGIVNSLSEVNVIHGSTITYDPTSGIFTFEDASGTWNTHVTNVSFWR